MLFDTLQYWVFFAVTIALVGSLPHREGKIVLVALSYVFYAFWDVRFLSLLAGSTLANYIFGITLESRQGAARKFMLATAVAFNIAVLGFFKYFNFFVASFASLFGVSSTGAIINIVLPVGVSFFTFESIAYVTDIYRRDVRAVRNPVDFALFVSFFPHLIAGPIIRPANFFPQAAAPQPLDAADVNWGLLQILKGLIKKVVFADFLGPIADACFRGTAYDGMTVAPIFGVLAFSFQIYFDFSGYTDIARGCAALLGYRFPPNFERPYLAVNVAEFWRRWHISLSTWLRDYLYFPLGGNRNGTARTYINLLIVMGLGGLWHGANWTFLLWGIYHGVLLVLHRIWRSILELRKPARLDEGLLITPISIAVTFIFVTIGWIPFRAQDLPTAIRIFRGLLTTPDLLFLEKVPGFSILILFSLLYCLIDRGRWLQHAFVKHASVWLAGLVTGLLLWLLEVFGQFDTAVPFIYFQF
jgi:alginate O-acetyltransferase complex protein AlgI